MQPKRRTAKFNGEYGFDESFMPQPPNVTETYDTEDDDVEDDIVCDPTVDYECDGDMLDNYDGWYYNEEAFDVYSLTEMLEKLKSDFEKAKLTYLNIYNAESNPQNIEYIDDYIKYVEDDIQNIGIYISNPMLFSDNVDMVVIIQTLAKTGTIPTLQTLISELTKL